MSGTQRLLRPEGAATIDRFPPGPKSRMPGGVLYTLQRDPLRLLTESARRYGDIFYVKIGPTHIYGLNRPDLIEDVLVTHHRNFVKSRGLRYAKRILGEGLLTSEGEFHLRQRRLIQPAFHRERINRYAAVMVRHAARTRDRWRDGATLDLHREMAQLTLTIVGETLFEADVESEADEVGDALTTSMEMFQRLNDPFGELLDRLPLASNRRYAAAQARLDATVYRLIQERRAGGASNGSGHSLLSMLLDAQDADSGAMSARQVRDEAMTLFLAGHETTANALTWAWYLLSQSPEAEAKLHAEVDAVLGERLPSMADLPRLSYAEKVLTESMRLYPPAWIIVREAVGEHTVDQYTVPPGSMLFLAQWVMHRDPRYFPEPERFDPDRWTPAFRAALPKFAYFPFGGGPRVCIGEPFAWTEGILLLATLAARWRMRLAPGRPVEPLPRITLRPKYGMPMTLEERKKHEPS